MNDSIYKYTRYLVKFVETEKHDCQVLRGVRNVELLFNGHRASICGDRNILDVDGGDGCTTMRIYLMPLNVT